MKILKILGLKNWPVIGSGEVGGKSRGEIREELHLADQISVEKIIIAPAIVAIPGIV